MCATPLPSWNFVVVKYWVVVPFISCPLDNMPRISPVRVKVMWLLPAGEVKVQSMGPTKAPEKIVTALLPLPRTMSNQEPVAENVPSLASEEPEKAPVPKLT